MMLLVPRGKKADDRYQISFFDDDCEDVESSTQFDDATAEGIESFHIVRRY